MKKPFFRQWWFWTAFVIIIIIVAALVTPEDEDKATTDTKSLQEEAATTKPADPPKVEKKDWKTTAAEVAKKQLASVESVSYNYDNGFLLIKGKGKENITNNYTVKGFKMSIFNIMKSIHDQKEIKTLAFNITYPLVDKYGNSSDQIVMKVEFSRATLDKINYDGFDFNNIGDVADSYWEHPAIRE
ncbi:hypothetical protein [Paenibacillus cineris]|uniref:hypothetical protein n=1 Tax=Paenibacillus cineris TaxID=237530 RepID=UPI001B01DD3D|nr:hypothetical protein [Paenibacillus cineris]GIO63594.1 hypothetical protein J43TS9_51680 [Paenibacillus cineris]